MPTGEKLRAWFNGLMIFSIYYTDNQSIDPLHSFVYATSPIHLVILFIFSVLS